MTCKRFFLFSRVILVAALSITWLGINQSAEAGVMTRDVDVTLNASTFDIYRLDLDQDGSADFTFSSAIDVEPPFPFGFDIIDPPLGQSAFVVDASVGDSFPTISRLVASDTIGPGSLFSKFGDQGNLLFDFPGGDPMGSPPTGNFAGATGFVGLRLETSSGFLYGFAEVTVNALDAAVNPYGLTIGRVGLSDVAGQSITNLDAQSVPEPTSLAVFACGGLVMLAGKRKRKFAKSNVR